MSPGGMSKSSLGDESWRDYEQRAGFGFAGNRWFELNAPLTLETASARLKTVQHSFQNDLAAPLLL